MRIRLAAIITTVVAASLLLATPAAAQPAPSGNLAPALTALQQAADQIGAGLQSTDPAVQRQQAQAAIATLQGARPTLEAVRAAPPSDFVRSRAEAVLDQLSEGVADLREALSGPDEQVDDKLREAEGQILEAIEELRPAAGQPPQPPPAQPAPAGGPGLEIALALFGLGAATLAAGAGLRRRQRAATGA